MPPPACAHDRLRSTVAPWPHLPSQFIYTAFPSELHFNFFKNLIFDKKSKTQFFKNMNLNFNLPRNSIQGSQYFNSQQNRLIKGSYLNKFKLRSFKNGGGGGYIPKNKSNFF